MPSQVDVEQPDVIDEFAGDRGGEGKEGDWDLLRAERPVTDVTRNEQQVIFRCVSELCWRIGATVRSDVMSFLSLFKKGFARTLSGKGWSARPSTCIPRLVSRLK